MDFAKTAYLEKKILNMVLLGETYTPPATVYLALFTADPGRSGSLTNEIADPEYARQEIAFTAADDDPASGSFSQNAYDVEFPEASEDWGTLTHVMIMDALTAGNGLYRAEFTQAKIIATGEFIKIPAGLGKIKED